MAATYYQDFLPTHRLCWATPKYTPRQIQPSTTSTNCVCVCKIQLLIQSYPAFHSFGRVVWLTPYKRAPPARELPHQFRSLSVKMVRAYAWRKNGPVAFLLLRSLKVIKTDMNQLGTCDFLLMFHSNHGLILYHFQHITRQCYRTTLCVSVVFAVVRCPSVRHIGGLYPHG